MRRQQDERQRRLGRKSARCRPYLGSHSRWDKRVRSLDMSWNPRLCGSKRKSARSGEKKAMTCLTVTDFEKHVVQLFQDIIIEHLWSLNGKRRISYLIHRKIKHLF